MTARPDVLVVGAGAAGIAAAGSLRTRGFSVLVLEAADRVGGRIRSHVADDGAVWELGAQVVHDRDNPVWEQLAATGPAAVLEPFATGEFRALMGGRSLPLGALFSMGLPPWLIVRALARSAAPEPGTLEAWLAGPGRAAGRVGSWWMGQEWAADPARTDTGELLEMAAAPGFTGGEARHPQGWQQTVDGLARQLDIRCRSVVAAVRLDARGVSAGLSDGTVLRADAAVVTVAPWTVRTGFARPGPAGAGGRGLALPGLPSAHRVAAAGLDGGDAVVAVLRTSRPAPADVTVVDVDRNWGFLRRRAGHPDVHVVAKGPGAQRFRLALAGSRAELAAGLAAAFPDLRGVAVEPATVADWGADPFVGGAFTTPGRGRAGHSRAWAQPWAQRVFFAGEATCPARGVARVHGALASGLRAAAEVDVALNRSTALVGLAQPA